MLTVPSPSLFNDGFEDPFGEEEFQPHPRIVIREIPPTPNVIVTKQDYETLLEEPDLSRILSVEYKNEISELKAPEKAPEEEEEEEAPEEEEEAPEEEEEEEEEENNTRQTIVIKGVAHSMDKITSMVYTIEGDLIGKIVNSKLVRNPSEK
jgi:negative regulator of genetic competence, sporulation and motility